MTDWLKGTPWYFYFVFIGVKLPLLSIAAFIVGLPLLFRRKIGDGRYFILFWMFVWIMMFMWAGGKFTRYFTVALPAVLITAAIGIQFAGHWIGARLQSVFSNVGIKPYIKATLAALVILTSVAASIQATPHFRLYTNWLGGGMARAGFYFPHDEFYDASMRDVMVEIARRAPIGAQVASESPLLAAHYAGRANRTDLICVSVSDPDALAKLRVGDFLIDARGRRYFSNNAMLTELRQTLSPSFTHDLGGVPSADVYVLNARALELLQRGASGR